MYAHFPPVTVSILRARLRLARFMALAFAAVLLLPGLARAADVNATPSNFASVFAAAQGGDRVLLASGSYGSFSGGAKSSMVTIDAQSGATPTMSGGNFGSSVRNITIRNVTFTGAVEVAPGSTPLNLVFDADHWGNVGHAAHEGRLSIIGGGLATGNGVQVKNSTFGPGGCSDGIQDSSRGTEIGPGNEFMGIVQGGCSEHADAIQPYASNNVYIHDNYLHDNEQGIMSPDGVSTGYRMTNNVIHTTTGYPCMHLGDTRNGSVTHNVCRNGGIRVYGGNQNAASQSMVVQDNAAGIDASACTGCTINHNQTVTYTGGSGRCAYATNSPKSTGSDGTDIGLNTCGGSPPPPPPPPPPPTVQCNDGVDNDADNLIDYPADTGCTSATDTDESQSPPPPPPPPPTDNQPTAAFTSTPTSPTPGNAVSFNGSTSTCRDTPCLYQWQDDGSDGAGGTQWPLGPNGQTSSFTFQETGVKHVRLTVTDADGDTATIPHDITVGTAPTLPPPPTTTISSGPQSTTTATTASFVFSASVSGATFQCQLDAAAYAACTSTKAYSALATGSHTFAVKATNAGGTGAAATRTWTVNPPATGGAMLLGTSTMQSVGDSNSAGTAQAFQATASGSGAVARLSVYVNSANTATKMIAGVYSDASGHPGTLITTGALSSITSSAWNSVTAPGASLVSGRKYWLALLGTGGKLTFRVGSGSTCHSEGSRSTSLTTLPGTWSTGPQWGSCPVSTYVTT